MKATKTMKILIIKLNKIGDVLLTSPLFANLKAHFKDCQIDLLANAGTEGLVDSTLLRHIYCVQRPKNFFRRLQKALALLIALKKEKYDIVHVNGNSTTMSIELLAAWFAGIKVRIAHSHNTTADHTKINKLLRPIFNLTVNGRVACNIAAGKWLFHQKKFLVIRNGINLSHFHFDESLRENYRKTLKLNKDDILLGNVGRFNRQKNQVVLLDLIKQLGDNYYLVLVGSGVNFEKIKKRVDSDVFLRKHIFFTGAVSDTSGWLNAMDLFLLPSLYEGQPYTLIEATASGLDAVVSNIISSENDLVSNISFERLDSPKDWVQKIKIPIANNRELRSNSYCQKLKEKGYDTTENAKMLLKYYKKKISLYK